MHALIPARVRTTYTCTKMGKSNYRTRKGERAHEKFSRTEIKESRLFFAAKIGGDRAQAVGAAHAPAAGAAADKPAPTDAHDAGRGRRGRGLRRRREGQQGLDGRDRRPPATADPATATDLSAAAGATEDTDGELQKFF